MALSDDLKKEVADVFRSTWEVTEGRAVPDVDKVTLGNKAVKIRGTILYADMASSTVLVDTQRALFAAEIYKTFLHCAAKVVTSEDGTITAYDGDRIMAVFVGSTRNTSAARAALKIHYARRSIVEPAMLNQYPEQTYRPKHVVGIDECELHVAKTGVRGANDLVWVGRAANHAAKLAALDPDYPTWITKEVYDPLHDSLKMTDGRNMWEARKWTAMSNRSIYRSSWWWPF